MSVEEAEAYAQQHRIEEALEAALNLALQELPADPHNFMAAQLRAGLRQDERPLPQEGAQLKPEVSAYMHQHDLSLARKWGKRCKQHGGGARMVP